MTGPFASTTPRLRSTTVVGVGELSVATSGEGLLVTYALGSCVGVTAWDPVTRVGGLLHAMLPTAVPGAHGHLARYVDTGIATMLDQCRRAGAPSDRLIMKAAGGSSTTFAGTDMFRIGERNAEALARVLLERCLRLVACDLGGCCSRTLSLDLATGRVTLKIDRKDVAL